MIYRVVLQIHAASRDDAALAQRVVAEEATTMRGVQAPSLRLRKEHPDASVDLVVTCDVAAAGEAAQMQHELERRVRRRILAEAHPGPIDIRASAFWRSPADH